VSHLVLSAPVARGILRRPGAKPEEKERFLAFLKFVERSGGRSSRDVASLGSSAHGQGYPPVIVAVV